jgi:molybdenum cofactor biosynthesis enzyme MoaA
MSTQKWINLGTLKNRKYDIIEKPIKHSKQIKNIPSVYLESRETKVNTWLNSKINGNEIESIYDVGDHCMPKKKKPYKVQFEEYYDKDDTDIKASAKYIIEIINELKENNELEDNDYYNELDFYMERYENDENDENDENNEILIPPSSNRHFANNLLKNMIDYSIDNNFDYKIQDEETEDIYDMNLFNKYIKDDFYQFCYDNTYKDRYF